MKTGFFSRVLLLASCAICPALYAQTGSDNPPLANTADVLAKPAAPLHVSALIKNDTQIGSGDEARYGALVEVHYTGWIYNNKAENLHGAQFDSSRTGGTPFAFQLGARQVIKGWDLGVLGMKVGGKRTLIIPSYLAYGTKGSASIPPNTHLVFDVELLSVK